MPTYNPDPTNPLDNSLVSAFPANERASRAAINSWMQREHALTGRHAIPSGSRATRDALADKGTGMWFYDTDNGLLEVWDGSAWTKSMGVWMPGDMKVTAYDPLAVGPGWLPCDGRAVSTTTYAALFAKIGTAFNTQGGQSAPAAGNFRVPRMDSAVPIGFQSGGDTDGDHDTIGEQVGTKKATIDALNVPRLNVTDTHRHLVPGIPAPNNAVATAVGSDTGVNGTASATTNTASLGSILVGEVTPTPLDIRQVSVVLGWLIKT